MNDRRFAGTLEAALGQSTALQGIVQSAWVDVDFASQRSQAAADMCRVSLDHAIAVQALLPSLPGSAIALMRLQFESLVRAAWIAHAATEAELGRLMAPLSEASQQRAKQLPGVPKMLIDLEKTGPRGAASLLARARTRLNDGLNSFVHGGIHPFARQRSGYPHALLYDVLCNSNAFALLSLAVLADLTQDGEWAAALPALHQEFADVLPELEPFPSAATP